MSLWCPYASESVGAIGRGYAATLDELTSHRRGRGGGLWGDFIEKTEQKQTAQREDSGPYHMEGEFDNGAARTLLGVCWRAANIVARASRGLFRQHRSAQFE